MIEDYWLSLMANVLKRLMVVCVQMKRLKWLFVQKIYKSQMPEEGKLRVKVDTQLFRGVHYEIIAHDELGNEWLIHSTRKAIEGEVIGLDFTPEDIHIMRLNETEEEFDARIEEYVEMEEHEEGLIHAIEEERNEEK